LHGEVGRGGYLFNGAGTTESQLMVIRGFMAAYQATGTALYLTRATEALTAFYQFYGFNATPVANTFYKYQWAGNLDVAVPIQEPVTDAPSNSGNLASPFTLSGGTVTISKLSKVYSIGDSASRLGYANVFAPVVGGASYTFWYYNEQGQKYDHLQQYQVGADDITQAGKVIPVGTTATQSIKITYCTNSATVFIAYKELAEFWSMWRKLGNNRLSTGDAMEANIAGDSIHWLLDVGLYMADNTLITAALATWNACVNQIAALDTYVVKKTVGALWNSEPYVFVNSFQNTGMELQPPNPSYYPVQPFRNASGQIVVSYPLDTTRTKGVIENDHCFINYEWGTGRSTLVVEIGSSLVQDCFILIKDVNNYVIQHHLWLPIGLPAVYTIPLEQFVPMYKWGASSTVTYVATTSSFDATFLTQGDGCGLPISNLAVLPLSYSSTTTGATVLTLRATYSNGSTASHSLVAGGVQQYLTLSAPVGLTISNIDFIPTVADSACTVSLKVPLGTALPTAKMVCRSMTLSFPATTGHVITLGGVSFGGVGSSHVATPYTGAVPFQIIGQQTRQSDGTAGYYGGASVAFISSYYTGYQSVLPYLIPQNLDASKDAKAYQVAKLFSDAQDFYATRCGVDGLFTPVYNGNYADGMWNGVVGTFSWQGADPNTFWGGFQYRAFEAAAHAYCYILENNLYSTAAALLYTVSIRFADWLTNWLINNPTAPCIPSTFNEGQAPQALYADSMFLAIALKALIYIRRAGITTYDNERVKIYNMLSAYNVSDLSNGMYGSFSVDPANKIAYGYQHGEVLEALGLYHKMVASGMFI
jgi:hypothetical protein